MPSGDGSRTGLSGTQIAVVFLGVGCLVASWLARNEAENFAILFGGAGVVFILAGLFMQRRFRAKAGPVEFEVAAEAEKEAAAKAADAQIEPAEVAREIESEDQGVPTPSPQDPDVIGYLNFLAGNMALKAIFDWTTADGQPLHGCSMRLYILDEDEQMLRPVLAPSDVEKATAWEVGKGATGAAYDTGEYVLAVREQVWDETYGIKPEQRERMRKIAAVAAAPVFNAAGETIGVVTVSTPSLDHDLDTDDARRDHNLASLLVSRVLVELLQWFEDRAPDAPAGIDPAVTPNA